MRKFTKLLALMMVLMMSVTSFAQQKSGSSLNECSFPVNYQQNSRDVAFTEDFTGDFPPAMWQNNILVGTRAWSQYNATTYSAATFGGFSGNDDAAELITPRLDLTAGVNDSIKFMYANPEWYGDQNVLEVYLTTNGGTDWTLLETYDFNTDNYFYAESLDLEAYTQTDDAYIKFKGINYWGYSIQLTDVQGPAIVEQGAPENFVAVPDNSSTTGNAKIALSWDAPSQGVAPAEYKVFRSTGSDFAEIATISETSYLDGDVVDNGQYVYYVTAIYDALTQISSPEQSVTAFVEPAFAITPETYTFDPVGLLDGVVFYGVDNAEYAVTNAGVGGFNVTEEPYLFSGQTDVFATVATASYPYEVSTGSFDFEVEFAPVAAGSFSSLLVVSDDLGRVVRTFPIEGSAYDIPDYDLVENAFEIVQDFGLVNDYVVADASFDGFYNDYELGATPKTDVVYTFNVDKESYIEFQAATGVSDFALFAEGDEPIEANDVYEDAQTAIEAGNYFFVVSGTADYGFTLHIEGQEPVLVVDPMALDLGDVPIGAWHEGGTFDVYNDGGQFITIESASLSDENNVYSLDYHFNLPTEITSNTLEFDVFLDAETDGPYEAAFLLTDDVTTHIYPITANAYTPVIGDVIENPIMVAFAANHFEDVNSVAAPMHDNYHLEDGYGDVVYKFSYATDMVINIANDNGALMAVYSAEDVATLSPEQLVPIAESATGAFVDLELWAGDYYLLLAGDPAVTLDYTVTPGYTVTFDVIDMPLPGAVTLIAPADGLTDVPLAPTLEWTVGDYTSDVTVLCGTTYPPTTVVYDGEVVETLEVEGLAPAQVYFWKVIASNQNGSTSSEQWAFTTMLPYPLYVQGEIFDYVNVHLWWNNPFQADITWTEDFEGGELPEGWTMTTVASGTSAGWIITDDFSSGAFSIPSHTIYAASNDDSNNDDGSEDYIITPAQNLTMGDVATLTFQSYYTGGYGQIATVEVSTDNGATWTVASTLEAADEWTEVTIDLTEYQETDLLIGFHSDDAGAWASGWAIDDVTLTLENTLPWETNRDFLGYNVYQDGALLTADPIAEEEYDVLELAAGTYVFGVSAVYNEGESDIIEIDAITILGMGAAEGVVTDVDTDLGIEGATVTFTANEVLGEVFVATTAADGTYAIDLPVFNGDYNVVCEASGYADYTNELVEVDATLTTTLDIEMGDIPITPSNVLAVASEDDTQAIITWSEAAPGDEFTEDFEAGIPADWTFVDEDGDGYNWDLADAFNAHSGVNCMYSASYINGVGALTPDNYMITPELNIGSLSTLRFWYVGQDPNYAAEHFYVKVSTTDNDPASFTEVVFEATATGDYQEGVVDLSAFAGQTAYIAFQHTEVTDMFYLNIDDISMTNVTRVTENNDYIAATSNEVVPFRTTDMTQSEIDAKLVQYNNNNSNDRQLESYAVYRLLEGEEENPAVWTLLDDDVQGFEYVDAEWVNLEENVYKYAVKAIYTLSDSDYGISNKLGKNMLCNAVVIVDLNTGDSPEGAVVTFTNTEEPEYVYTATVPASGTVNFIEIWKGNYDVTVSMDLYDTYEANFDVNENYFVLNVTLIETLATPINLASEVECNDVHLSWEQGTSGGSTGLASFEDDFETGAFAEGWILDNPGGSNAFGVTDANPLDGSYGVQTAWGYGIDTWMITPEIDVTGDGVVSFLWSSSYYWSVDPNDNCDLFVKVSTDGGSTWDAIWTFGDIGVWENFVAYETSLDLSAYAGESVMIAFNEVGDDNANVNIDNVYVGPQAARSIGTNAVTTVPDVAVEAKSAEGVEYSYLNNNSREFIGYNVYRDGFLLTSEPIAETEYWDNDLAGGLFVYEVSAVYSTGESVLTDPIEVEVEVINAPMNLTAEKQAWNNVELNWDAPSNQPIYSLHWDDGVAYTAIGTGEAFDFDVASRWAVSDLAQYDGMSLTKVSFFPNEEACEYSIRVWIGDDVTLVVDQVVAAADIAVGAWNTVELTTPVAIDASQELWFGYRANATTGFPAGCDAGHAVAGKGDMIYDAEEGWVSMSEAYGLDYNWNIAGTVMALDDAMTFDLGEIVDVDRNNDSKGVIKSNGIINSDRLVVDRAFSSYNVYRDGVQINVDDNGVVIPVTIPFYVDYDLPIQAGVGVEFAYNVEAIFESGCVSGFSNTETVDYGTGVNPLDENISIYPNPATSYVNVVIPSNIESLRVMNNLGQVVYQENILGNDKVQLNTERYNSGNYMIQFTTNNGAILNKRFVVVK